MQLLKLGLFIIYYHSAYHGELIVVKLVKLKVINYKDKVINSCIQNN